MRPDEGSAAVQARPSWQAQQSHMEARGIPQQGHINAPSLTFSGDPPMASRLTSSRAAGDPAQAASAPPGMASVCGAALVGDPIVEAGEEAAVETIDAVGENASNSCGLGRSAFMKQS
mmetsp:Transcript_79311/g.227518  ORF Transcript_79311/g.227518 Transcript_79311/m.227518 type:complete len:118 (-) Transcript_79311:147-500(-)